MSSSLILLAILVGILSIVWLCLSIMFVNAHIKRSEYVTSKKGERLHIEVWSLTSNCWDVRPYSEKMRWVFWRGHWVID